MTSNKRMVGRVFIDHYEISFIQANIANKTTRALTWAANSNTNKGEEDDCFGSVPNGLSEFSHKTNPAANWWSGLPSGMMLSNIQFNSLTKDVTLHYENAFAGVSSNKVAVISEIPISVKEGANPFQIVVTTTNIADGEKLKLMPPSDAWSGNMTVKNMLDNYGENRYKIHAHKDIFITTTGQSSHSDGVLRFKAQRVDYGVPVNTKTDKVRVTYGQGVTSDGVSYKPTTVEITLTSPIIYI